MVGAPVRQRAQRAILAWLAIPLALAVVLASVLALYLIALTRQPPDEWAVPDMADETIIRRAETVEQGMTNALSRPMPPDENWTIEITQADANAWLATRLPRWLLNRGHRWPDSLIGPTVDFQQGRASLLVGQVIQGREPRVLGVWFAPEVTGNGGLRLTDVRARVGRLTVPASMARQQIERLTEAIEDATGGSLQLGSVLLGEAALTATSTISLNDGRTVQVVRISIEPGRVLLTCRTSRAGESGLG